MISLTSIKGKLIGGILGALFFHLPGLIIGLFLGHLYDQHLGSTLPTQVAQNPYYRALFLALGRIAKADGQITPKEIQMARVIMQQLGIQGNDKKEAIELFYQGKRGEFSLEENLQAMLIFIKGNHFRVLHFYNALMRMAYIDGTLDPNTSALLREIAEKLNIRIDLNYYESIFGHYQHQQYQRTATPTSQTSLSNAYAVLGLTPKASLSEVKKTYRRLMSQYHPDKLMSKGLPEAEIQKATEKVQKIRAAYERILAAHPTE